MQAFFASLLVLLGCCAAFAAEKDVPVPKTQPALAAAPASAPASATAPRKPAAPHRGPQDPIEFLRERLAAKLGGAAAHAEPQSGVIRVVNRATPGDAAAQRAGSAAPTTSPKPAAAAASAAGRTARPAPPTQRTVAAAPRARVVPPAIPWAYEGAGGPQHWAELAPEYAACARGNRQSPIDIEGGIAVDLDPIAFDYRASGFRVVDNDHTVQVDVDPGSAIEVLGRRYELQQFHFHLPAEERVAGRRFAMVAHLVHRSADDRIAIVAVLLEPGDANAAVQAVWNNLPLERGEPVVARKSLELASLLPADAGYYTFMGSLTTPPCTEGVLWMVMREPLTVSAEQIATFARLHPMNARPVQRTAGRLIKQSN